MKASKLILVACAALFLFCGCKSRKVLTTHKDSVSVSQEDKKVHAEVSKVDTSKKTTQKFIITTDSNFTTVNITPVPGHVITINKDGSFTGEASNVVVTRRGHTNTNQSEKSVEQKGTTEKIKVDSAVSKKQTTKVHTKEKAIETKPDYSWIWWLCGGIVFLVACYLVWRKFT